MLKGHHYVSFVTGRGNKGCDGVRQCKIKGGGMLHSGLGP